MNDASSSVAKGQCRCGRVGFEVRSAPLITMLADACNYRPFIETYMDEKLEWVATGAKRSFTKYPPQETFPGLLQEYAHSRE